MSGRPVIRSVALMGLGLALVSGAPRLAAAEAPAAVLVAPGSGTVRALVIGIDHYRNVNPLHGAVADARDIDTSLRTMGSTDITTLIDDRADRTTVLAALNDLVARSGAGDLVIVTIAGHGAKEPERQAGSSRDGSDEVFLLAGFDPRTGAGGADKILNHEFHHFIKAIEGRGAQVIFVADTCYGGGLAREIAPGAPDVSYRQVVYRLAKDDLKPVSTPADAYLNDLDFQRTTFLAAVDSETKAPEVKIGGVYRGALSYAMARAIEGAADEKHDGKVTMRELFSYARKVVYQLSDERQNIVTIQPPDRDLDREIVLRLGQPGAARRPASAAPVLAAKPSRPEAPVRLAALSMRPGIFAELRPLQAAFDVVDADALPDVVWDPVSREALAGGDTIAFDVDLDDLPGVIDRMAAVRDLKSRVVKAPQAVTVLPDAQIHRGGERVEVEVDDAQGRNMVLLDVNGSGTVQLLYPRRKGVRPVASPAFRIPFAVRDPFGADEVLAITSSQPMDDLADALGELDNRRSAGRLTDVLSRFAPPDARFGLVGVFTVR